MGLKEHFYSSRHARLRRLLRLDIRIGIGLFYGFLIFAFLLPLRLEPQAEVYLAAYQFTIIARAFLFHLGVGAMLGLLWAIRLRWRGEAMALAPIMIFCLYDTVPDFLPKSKVNLSHDTPTVSILTANLLYTNIDANPILRVIQRTSPDVILFQEYTQPMDDVLSPTLRDLYPHSTRRPEEGVTGTAFFSKLPVIERTDPSYEAGPESTPVLRGTVRTLAVGNRELAVYGIHLTTVFHAHFLNDHNAELVELAGKVSAEKFPCVVAGDFNFTSTNAQTGVLRNAGLRDAWKERGWGRGSTWCALWPLRYLPGFRIDQMQMNDSVDCIEIKVLEDIGSDHYPLLGTFALR